MPENRALLLERDDLLYYPTHGPPVTEPQRLVRGMIAHHEGAVDMAKLFLATLSPSDLSGKSLGMCAHLPFAEQVIDFDAIPKLKPEFYINAYNMNRAEMTIWGKGDITPAHLRAAFSFPLIYPPYTDKAWTIARKFF